MTTTFYSFHRAEDHAIRATAEPGNLQAVAAQVARSMTSGTTDETRRVYVHNGLGVVAAGLCRAGIWHDILRDDYRQFDEQARAERAAYGLPNDEKPRELKQPRRLKPYRVEYMTPEGRFDSTTVEAGNAADAMDAAVTALGIDFDAIQTTEERGA